MLHDREPGKGGKGNCKIPRRPRPTFQHVEDLATGLPQLLTRFLAAALFIVVAGGAWDVWWHGAVGRDSFWEPPHILLQSAVLASMAGALYGWVRLRTREWNVLVAAAALVPVSAPFDELWHRAFGVENLSSPMVIWSPPHLVLVGGLIAATIQVTLMLRADADTDARALFTGLTLASLLDLLLFLALPLDPLGPYHLWGFAGSALPALFLSFILLTAPAVASGVGRATMVTVFFLALTSLTFAERRAPGVIVPPHGHVPPWLVVFSFGLPALVADLVDSRRSQVATGGVIGLLSAAILYGAAPSFIEAPFRFPLSSAAVAVIAAVLGGIAGGALAARSTPWFQRGMTSRG